MKNKIIITTLIFTILVMPLVAFFSHTSQVCAEGIGVTLGVSSGTVEAGSNVTVTVGTTFAVEVTNYNIEVAFDPNVFEYTGSSDLSQAGVSQGSNTGSSIVFAAYNGSSTSSALCQMNFTAKAPGSGSFTIVDAEVTDQFPPTGASATVSVTTPLPGNANLSSLSVDQGTLSPAFHPDTLNYSLPVAMGVNSVLVSATPEDPAAGVSVSGNTALSDGSNTISVVVTAQNGSQKIYTIIANRLGPTPTPEPTPTPPPSVLVDGMKFSVIEVPEGLELPPGFEKTTITIGGQQVVAYKSAAFGDWVLLYLINESGSEAGFHLYNEKTSQFFRYKQLSVAGHTYTVMPLEDESLVPAGFAKEQITIDAVSLDCWHLEVKDKAEFTFDDIYLLYLMDEKGDKQFYLYQKATNLIFPYAATQYDTLIKPQATPTPAPSPTPEPTPEPEEEPASTSIFANPYFIVTIILAVIVIVLVAVLVKMIISSKYEFVYEDEEDEEDANKGNGGAGNGAGAGGFHGGGPFAGGGQDGHGGDGDMLVARPSDPSAEQKSNHNGPPQKNLAHKDDHEKKKRDDDMFKPKDQLKPPRIRRVD